MLLKFKINKIVMMIICIVIAWILKYHYSNSNSDDLWWILTPTASLVEFTGDMTFEKKINTGYADHEGGIIIAPSCSGVNFMIILFCLSAYMGLKKIKTTSAQFMWIMGSVAGAYIYTLIVNTFRITLSIYSIKVHFLETWFSQETVHLLQGVLIYFIFILIYNSLLNRVINHNFNKNPDGPRMLNKNFLLPLFFYLSFTLLVPLLNNGGLLLDNGFTLYAFIVLICCFIVFTTAILFRVCCHYAAVKVK